MTRVLHFIPNMGGGGAERELAHLAGPIRRSGIDVHVALVSEGPNYERLAASGVEIHRIQIAHNHDPRLPLRIGRIIGRVRPDLVQTWITQMDVAAGAMARMRGVPWILSERNSTLCYTPTIKNVMRVRVGRGSSLIQANSEAGAQYWAEQAPRVRSLVIAVPAPIAEIDATPAADLTHLGKREGVPLLLYAGRLAEQKNIETMLRAFAEVFRARPAVAVLCGEGPQDAEVRRWVRELGIADRVVLSGYVHDIWSWMKAADVFVSVANFEGRPNTVVEAAVARCPMVVSDIPEHREFLRDGVHALLAEHRDPGPIAAAIHNVLDDREAARRRADAAYAVVAEWTIDRIAPQHVAMYEDVLRYHSRRLSGVRPENAT